MSGSRLSDRELAAINAAAVTKAYQVQPHLGELYPWLLLELRTDGLRQIIGLSPLSMGEWAV
jgi:hypothetical protein